MGEYSKEKATRTVRLRYTNPDQAQQLQKIAALERSSQEQLGKINLLEARVETLEQDNSALQEKASNLQEKAKTLAKEKKGICFLLWCL